MPQNTKFLLLISYNIQGVFIFNVVLSTSRAAGINARYAATISTALTARMPALKTTRCSTFQPFPHSYLFCALSSRLARLPSATTLVFEEHYTEESEAETAAVTYKRPVGITLSSHAQPCPTATSTKPPPFFLLFETEK